MVKTTASLTCPRITNPRADKPRNVYGNRVHEQVRARTHSRPRPLVWCPHSGRDTFALAAESALASQPDVAAPLVGISLVLVESPLGSTGLAVHNAGLVDVAVFEPVQKAHF